MIAEVVALFPLSYMFGETCRETLLLEYRILHILVCTSSLPVWGTSHLLELTWDNRSILLLFPPGGGAGSEVWNRVYMIAPVKKFGRVRLSSNFPSKQIWRRMRTWKDDEFFARFYVLRRPNIKKRFSWTFFMKFLDIRRRDVWTVHEWLRSSWFGTLASSVQFISFVNFRATSLRAACSISYIFFHVRWY